MKLPWGNRDTGAGRRKHERCSVSLPSKLVLGERTYVGTCINLSMDGVMLRFPEDMDVMGLCSGELATVSVLLPNCAFETRVKIVRIVGHGAAVRFYEFQRTKMEKLLYEYLETQLGDVW